MKKNKKQTETKVDEVTPTVDEVTPTNEPKPTEAEALKQQKQEALEDFNTPPAGVYPKTDSKGRVIKYKRRGGIFAFFMGIFATLFLLVFCGGLVASYFYYCYKFEDLGKTVGVDLTFLSDDVKNKTANELMKLVFEYKDGYTNMTVSDMKDKVGIDVADMVKKNLGVEIEDFYNIQIKVDGVNGGNTVTVGNLKVQDFMNHLQPILDKLLPEFYKKVELEEVLKLIKFDPTTINLPLTQDEIIDVTPNRHFVIGTEDFELDLTKNQVLKDSAKVADVENNTFTLNAVTYTINDDRTKLVYGTDQEIPLTHTPTYKEFSQLSVYELLYTVLPTYAGGSEFTLGFLQTAIGKEFIPTDNPEFAKLLNSKLTAIDVQDILSSISVGGVLTLVGDSITLPENILFLHTQDFKDQKLKDALTYIESLTLQQIINVADVEFYDNFVLNEQTLYIVNSNVVTKSTTNLTTENALKNFSISTTNYSIYKNGVYNASTSTSVSFDANKRFTLDGVSYYYINDDKTEILDSEHQALDPQVLIDGNYFVLDDKLCIIHENNSTITVLNNASVIEKGRFTLNTIEFFMKDAVLESFSTVVSPIDDENHFIVSGTTYTVDKENKQIKNGTTKVADINKTETIKRLVFNLRNVVLKDLIDGKYDEAVKSLDGITISDLLGNNLTGFLETLKDVSLYDILSNPNVMLDNIKTTTLEELGIDPTSSVLLENIAPLTIGEILEDNNAILNALKEVELSALGFSSTSPLFDTISTLTIGDLLDNPEAILDAIEDKKLNEITGSYDGIMGVIGNITIGDLLNNGNVITNTLSNSTQTLAYLLGQYDKFVLSDKTYYIIEDNIYESSNTSTPVASIYLDEFVIGTTTYQIDGDNIKQSGTTVATITRAPTSSLAQAILSMQIKDLFGGNMETAIQSKINDVRLGDIIPSSSNALLSTLITKNPKISELGDTIGQLKLNEVFPGAGTTGILKLLEYTPEGGTTVTGGDIPLMNLMDAFNGLNIYSQKITDLYKNGVLPDLEDTYFDDQSAAYNSLTASQKSAVDNLTLQSLIADWITEVLPNK